MHERETVQLGDFECKSGKLVVSDPCYDLDTWCAGVVNAKKGKWHAEMVTSDEGSWGNRVAVLRAYHHDHQSAPMRERATFEVGVDSGQAGIFDKAVFKKDKTVPDDFKHKNEVICEDDPWYSYVCDHTLGKEQGGVIFGGVVTSSGYGDGGYDCRLALEPGKSDVVGIEITFLPESVTCDECGASFDPDEISMSGICDSCQEELDREEDEDEDEDDG